MVGPCILTQQKIMMLTVNRRRYLVVWDRFYWLRGANLCRCGGAACKDEKTEQYANEFTHQHSPVSFGKIENRKRQAKKKSKHKDYTTVKNKIKIEIAFD